MLDGCFKTQEIQTNSLKSRKKTASYDNRALNLFLTFFGGRTLKAYKKNGSKI